MPDIEEQITRLQAAIAAQESLRHTLGEGVVETTLTTLRTQLDTLRRQQRATGQLQVEMTPQQLLEQLHSFIPSELAEKMRTTGHIEGERKQVTVIFADFAGFTALSESLDPEEVTAIINEGLKELAEAVYRYEGYIT